mmetsp:Transcript_5553/g.14966  ORF Transcript_5553/g.14966 Transcript_5553/m.14966 type:complete len:204 (+) Transcript_5553:1260-1871(+)
MLDVLFCVAPWPASHKVKAPAIKAITLEVLHPLDDVPTHEILRVVDVWCRPKLISLLWVAPTTVVGVVAANSSCIPCHLPTAPCVPLPIWPLQVCAAVVDDYIRKNLDALLMESGNQVSQLALTAVPRVQVPQVGGHVSLLTEGLTAWGQPHACEAVLLDGLHLTCQGPPPAVLRGLPVEALQQQLPSRATGGALDLILWVLL